MKTKKKRHFGKTAAVATMIAAFYASPGVAVTIETPIAVPEVNRLICTANPQMAGLLWEFCFGNGRW